jgi:hypothetical protein
MKTNDYIKYMTQEFVKYIDQPVDIRRKIKEEKKLNKEPFLSKWFGVLPLSVSMIMTKDTEVINEEKETS